MLDMFCVYFPVTFALSGVILTPYIPIPETNAKEWDRLEPASALDVIVELALYGSIVVCMLTDG